MTQILEGTRGSELSFESFPSTRPARAQQQATTGTTTTM